MILYPFNFYSKVMAEFYFMIDFSHFYQVLLLSYLVAEYACNNKKNKYFEVSIYFILCGIFNYNVYKPNQKRIAEFPMFILILHIFLVCYIPKRLYSINYNSYCTTGNICLINFDVLFFQATISSRVAHKFSYSLHIYRSEKCQGLCPFRLLPKT